MDADRFPAATDRTSRTDRFFRELDGLVLQSGRHGWSLAIYSVMIADGRRWFQIGLDGTQLTLLHISAALSKSPTDILGSLRRVLTDASRVASFEGKTLMVD